jgi:hypothetical protein
MNATSLLRECPGLTYRKLDSWCTEGVFGAHNRHCGSGRRRTFTDEDLTVARLLARVSSDLSFLFGTTAGSWPLYQVIAEQIRAGRNQVALRLPDGLTLTIDVYTEPRVPIPRTRRPVPV